MHPPTPSAYVPGKHEMQSDAALDPMMLCDLPAEQSTHTLLPSTSVYLPGPQNTQALAVLAETVLLYLPRKHNTQSASAEPPESG